MICGHIHRAEITDIDGVLYCNDGDWVESCTTLTEDFSGRLSLLRWTERKEVVTHTGLLHRSRSNRPREDCDRHGCLASADERRRQDTEHDRRAAARAGSRSVRDRAESVPHVSLPDLSGDPARVVPLSATRRDCSHHSIPMPCTSRPKARSGVAARRWCLRHRLSVHDVVSHAVSGIRARACADSAGAELRAPATLSCRRATHDGGDAGDAAAARSARLSQHRALDARRGCRAVQAARQGIPGIPAADRDVRRARGGGKEHRGVPAHSNCPAPRSIVGDGPARAELQRRYPSVRFVGYKFGEELAAHIAAADVFVFPSRTDTFGLVLLEAMACGVPVAAYPVTGPIDVVQDGVTGALDADLRAATLRALQLDPMQCRAHALRAHVGSSDATVPVESCCS